MEVVVQSPSRSPTTTDNFDLSGAMISPYLSAPSSPKRFGEYYSEFYHEFDYFSSSTLSLADNPASSSSIIPFEAPPNNMDGDDDEDDDGDGDFAFYVSRESDTSSRSAEELFDGGIIKPLEPESNEMFTSHKTTLEGKKVLQTFSPKKRNPFPSQTEKRRGRDRTPAAVLSSSNSGRRVMRSHSPNRISEYTWEEEQRPQQQPPRSNIEESTLMSSNPRALISSASSSSSSSSKGSRRWRLRDFLLFRSASEGRGSSKDPFKKYSVGYKKSEEVKASSFRSSDSLAPGSRKKGPVSAHELHYAMKKAESEDLKKRTFLPYKQGILGRLAGFGL